MSGEAFLTARDAGAALSYQDAGELACELVVRAREVMRPVELHTDSFPRIRLRQI